MSTTSAEPGPGRGLCTDLYEVRMAASYLRRGMTAPASFSVFARRLPRQRGFLVAAGLEACLDRLAAYRFDDAELAYLRDEVGLPTSDVAAMADLTFQGSVRAVPEGRVVLADEPLVEVTAPLPQAQLVETLVLNQVTFATSVASKAVRCRLAAPGALLVDFAARRAHGLEAALAVARATAVAGFSGTSYVHGARCLGLPAVGTMAHSYVQAFEDEANSFRAFGEDFPDQSVFLVDTYDTVEGVRRAIDVARGLGLSPARVGVRLDSGDLGALARTARRMLDEAGMREARIMASGGLDEHALAELVGSGAPIDSYGMGTKVGVSWDAPSLDSAYKLVAYDGRPVMKLSPGKATDPGAKQVHRGRSVTADLLALHDEPPPDGTEPLLVPVMADGRRTGPPDTVPRARQRLDRDLVRLPEQARALVDPVPPTVTRSPALLALTTRLRRGLATAGDP